MQSDQYKGKLEQRLKARRRAERNILMRRKYIYQASFHRWWVFTMFAQILEAALIMFSLLFLLLVKPYSFLLFIFEP